MVTVARLELELERGNLPSNENRVDDSGSKAQIRPPLQ
jgi:hypothetical protein